MIVAAIEILVFISLGLYAGKRRAKGMGWFAIVRDLFRDFGRTATSVWRWLSYPFRKEDPNVEVVDAEVIPPERNA